MEPQATCIRRQGGAHRVLRDGSFFSYGKILQPGGMAERLKAHVLKTCLGHTNVGSNPTPSATQFAFRCDEPWAVWIAGRHWQIVNCTGEVPEWSNGAAC